MPNTYSQLYIQAVFAVKYRNAVIDKSWRQNLMAVIGNLINETGCKTIIVNGVEDHVHCFFILQPKLSISDVMQSVKAKSSKWVNESKLILNRFEWQRGFGAFSYSKSHVDNVYNYIANQEAHHHKETFKEEYTKLLKAFGVEYDEDYYFEALLSDKTYRSLIFSIFYKHSRSFILDQLVFKCPFENSIRKKIKFSI